MGKERDITFHGNRINLSNFYELSSPKKLLVTALDRIRCRGVVDKMMEKEPRIKVTTNLTPLFPDSSESFRTIVDGVIDTEKKNNETFKLGDHSEDFLRVVEEGGKNFVERNPGIVKELI